MRYLYFVILLFTSYNLISQENTRGNERDEKIKNKENMRTLLDDSSKVIYGMNTTSFILKENLVNGDTTYNILDSSLYNFEKSSFIEKELMKYQNLGVVGTPVYDIFNPENLSYDLVSGFNSLDPYFNKSFNLYDTRSPFIDLNLFFGGNGRSKVDFLFSRNINKNWNIGFNLNRISSDKQIGISETKGDKNVNSSSFNLNVFHKSKNKKITFFSSYNTFKHEIFGTGGVDIEVDSLPLSFFIYNDFDTRLKDIKNIEKRGKFNSYFDYRIFNGLKLYNELTYSTQSLYYEDLNLSQNIDFYSQIINNSSETSDSLKVRVLRNKVGVKGQLKSFSYNIYANLGLLRYKPVNDKVRKYSNTYIGGLLSLKKENFNIRGNIDLKSIGDYKLEAIIENKFFEVKYLSGLYEPNLFQLYFRGNHYNWDNNFKSTFFNKLSSHLKYEKNNLYISPFLGIISINDYIYLSDSMDQIQVSDVLNYNQIGLDFKFSLFNRIFNFENKLTYSITSKSAKNIINIPKTHSYSRIYYEGTWFSKSVPVQLGLNFFYRSEYFGNAYEPSLQSYYVQNSFKLENYLRYNIFFSMQVTNLRIYLKMTHFNQFDRFDGYFITPYYPAQKKVLDLGIRWYFFN